MAEKKRLYVQYIETLCRFGYDISNLLNPTYSKINYDYIAEEIVSLVNEHEEVFVYYDYWFQVN